MNTDEPDLDRALRQTMTDVVDHMPPAADFADRLIANSREGRVTITPLDRARRGSRWTTPLLAAAIVILVAGGVVLGKATLGSKDKQHPLHPSPSVTQLPSNVTTPSPSPTQTTQTPAFPGFAAAGVDFTDSTTGWALGTDKGKAELLHTTDGTHWHKSTVPSGLRPPSDSASCGNNGTILGPCVDHVTFVDAKHGYLWGLHELYTTDNGGKDWTRVAASGQPGTVQLVPFGNHVLRMHPTQACSAGCTGILQIATVGSDGWTTVTPTTSGLYTSQLAVNGKTAYFLSGQAVGAAGGKVYRSTDGVHWTPYTNSCGPSAYGLAAGFDGSLAVTCLTNSKVRIAPAGSTAFGAGLRLPGDGATVFAMLSAKEFFALYGHKVFRTTDGDVSIQQIGVAQTDTAPIALSEHFMYAPSTKGRTLLVSTDGGITWQPRVF